jgi:hypothetical protein
MNKRLFLMIGIVIVAVIAAVVILLRHNKGNISDGPDMEKPVADSIQRPDNGSVSTGVVDAAAIQVPELFMIGPLDPIPDESTGEYYVLQMANLGAFTSLEQLRQSPFYPQLCSAYPELPDISSIIDTGKGDLWLLKPWTENTSLSLNEYNLDMFLGEREPGTGTVYYRTENFRPMLLRMTTDDPGSVQINAVDNEGHVFSWVPTSSPADNVLREELGVAVITYNPVDNSVEFGADYTAEVGGKELSIRFYADRLVSFNHKMMHYYACHQKDDSIGVLFTDGDSQCYALIDGYAPDVQFTLKAVQGTDIGLPIGTAVTFKRVN